MPEGNVTPPDPTNGPTQPSYMQESIREMALRMAAELNKRNDAFFLSDTIRDWVIGVTENGNKWGLPASPQVYVGRAERVVAGWVPVLEATGQKYGRVDLLLMLDLAFQQRNNTEKSLWDVVPSQVRALCGLENPETPGKFGGPVGALPGCYWLAHDDLPAPEWGTTRTVDGIEYVLRGTIIKYWKPV